MKQYNALITISFLFCMVSILFVWFGDPDIVSVLKKEDGVIENLSVIFYMTALIFSFISILKNEHMVLPIIWFVLCFLFIGEETSWFQRQLDYSVPWVEKVNAQSEFNFHNLNVLHGGKLMNSSIGFSSFLKSQNLFRLGFFGYFLIIPLLLCITKFKGLMSKIDYIKPDTGFILLLTFVFGLSFFLALLSPENVKSALAETREMLYAFFIMLYVISYIWPNKKKRRRPAPLADYSATQFRN